VNHQPALPIGALEQVLDHMISRRGAWSTTGAEIVDACRAQQDA